MTEEDPNSFNPWMPSQSRGQSQKGVLRAAHGLDGPDVARRGLRLRFGLRLRLRPETLGADTAVDAESHRRGARTVRVLGVELGNDPLWRRYYPDLTKSRVIGDITRGMPVSVETPVTCINPAVRSRCSVKLPNIGALTVVHSLAAGGRPVFGGERGYILPDELTIMTHRPLLQRPRTAAQRGAQRDNFQNSHLVIHWPPDSFSPMRRAQGYFGASEPSL
jgi:hypothetical protein